MPNVTAPGEPVERLIQAIRDGRSADVQVLVESNPDLTSARDVSGVSAILLALYHGRPEIANWLASKRDGLDVFEASSLGDLGRVQVLLSADPSLASAWSADGFTALGLASFFGQVPVVRTLVAAGADVNAIGRNPGRYTPLTGAVTSGHVEVVRDLLRHGAEVNYRYAQGLTPLHVAAANGNAEMVQVLLDGGARADIRADDRKSAADYAREKAHAEIAALLDGRRT